ncbi:MAG: NosD domain-containing protein [Thermoplasmata archaeon]
MKLESKTPKSLGLRNGRDNTRGFTNGLTNGFTNGNSHRTGRKLKESRNHDKILAVFVLAMLVLSVVAFLTWQSGNASSIKIDGSFEDWQGVEKTTKGRDVSVPENIDIEEYATADLGKNVAFYAKVHGRFLAGNCSPAGETLSEHNVSFATQRETAIPNVNGRDVAYVFVDTDNNPTTGFKPSVNFAVGADRAIEMVGKNGKIEASRVLSFAGVVQQEWTWNIGDSVPAATNGKEMETMATKSVLGIGESYAVYFYMIDWNGNKGMVDNAFQSENAKVSMSGLYLNSHATARAKSTEMEVKGTPHPPIHINGNYVFAHQAASEGWPGDGSEGNPYIIDGYDIDANGGRYGFWIENTDAYFVIRNCSVRGATDSGSVPYGAGIALINVRHGTLDSNKCNNSNLGIYLYKGSQYNTMTNNNASSNTYGILLSSSSNNIITNNNASGNGYGIYLYYSSNNSITNNTASGNSEYGIYLGWDSSNNSITNNTASGNSLGIFLEFSSNNNITNNTASGNSYDGIFLDYSSNNNNITNNNASSNSLGISLWFSSNNSITNNNASGNSRYGICLYYSSNNSITNNNASGNSNYGIHLNSSSDNNNITNNNASGNGYGIYLSSSSNNIITNNNASGNSQYGIFLELSSNNTITNNNASGNSNYGIYLLDSSNNIITNNNASGNSQYGIFLELSSNNTITNNNASGNGYGIYLDHSSDNNITYNWICYNTKYGLYISWGSTGNTIHHNNFIRNNCAGKGVSGNCQACAHFSGNFWYDNTSQEGNYWSNWDGNGWGSADAYPIAGSVGASDWYPLERPVSELSVLPIFMLAITCLGFFLRARTKRS